MNKCQWKEDLDGAYATECGEGFWIESGSPSDNKMNFCPYCGNEIEEVRECDDPRELEAGYRMDEMEDKRLTENDEP